MKSVPYKKIQVAEFDIGAAKTFAKIELYSIAPLTVTTILTL